MNELTLRRELAQALQWEQAHAGLQQATRQLSLADLGNSSHQLPYTIWQLTEHIRLAQQDIVSFCLDDDYQEMQWPDDYWPGEAGPASMKQWEHTLQAIRDERQRLVDRIQDPAADLFAPLPNGNGQHLFREAMLIIDHEAYHTGQIILIRKILNKW